LLFIGFDLYIVASMGVSEGKTIGEWFGPNTVAQVLRSALMFLSLTAELFNTLNVTGQTVRLPLVVSDVR